MRVTRVGIILGEVETNHLINRRRGKADVRVPEDRIEFLDAGKGEGSKNWSGWGVEETMSGSPRLY